MPGLVDCGVVLRTALPSGNAFFFRRLISLCRVQFIDGYLKLPVSVMTSYSRDVSSTSRMVNTIGTCHVANTVTTNVSTLLTYMTQINRC